MLKTSDLLANNIVKALGNNKGHQIVKIDLRKIENCFCSFFVICHGTSNTQVSALADAVEEEAREGLNEKPYHIEGQHEAKWIVLDYGDVIAHIFQKEQRDYYQLEDFWADAEITEIDED